MLLSEFINNLITQLNTIGDGQIFVKEIYGLCSEPHVICEVITQKAINEDIGKMDILHTFIKYKIEPTPEETINS